MWVPDTSDHPLAKPLLCDRRGGPGASEDTKVL